MSGRAAKRTKAEATSGGEAPAAATARSAVGIAAFSGDNKPIAQDLVNFINHAWTPYHAVEEASRRLMQAGFQHISEKAAWDVKPGGKYFFTRNMSTICAFAVGEKYVPGNGFFMIGAHTDSPCLKLKPVSKSSKSGWLMINVETYGGGLWYTWFDRDLGLAGRVLVRGGEGEQIQHRLVRIDRPILRIPMLAIHLQRDIHSAGFKPNLQTNFAPVLATAAKAQLDKPAAAAPASTSAGGESAAAAALKAQEANKHHSLLLEMVAQQLGVAPADILDFELHVCDVQPATLGGATDEFVLAGRLDNLCMSYLSLQAMLDTCTAPGSLAEETGVRAIALFDHEEVGSESAQGAGGPLMRDTITRVASALSKGEEGAVERAMRSSFLVSADMAHALHPNYADKHDPDHQPKMHEGMVLKHNSNQRYATNSVSAALFREVGHRRGIPCQEFSVRNDTPCGSTIGPILSSLLGCRTVDVGVAQLSMHSIREMCGVDDIGIAYKHFVAFFEDFSALDKHIDVDALPPANIIGTISGTECHHTHSKGPLIDPTPK